MSALKECVRAAKHSGDFGPLVEAIPYARFLGLRAEVSDGELITRLTASEHLIGNPALPALHGGTIGALLESAAIFSLFYEAENLLLPKTITITVDYLRSAKPVDTFARGIVSRLGRRVATVRAEAWQEDRSRLVATANVHLLVKSDEG